MTVQHVTIVGAGIMGSGIAQVFAQSGYEVTLIDLRRELAEKGYQSIKQNLEKLVQKGKLDEEKAGATLKRIQLGDDLGMVSGAQVVIEAIFEKMKVKKELLEKLDALCLPGTIFASNTSSLSITEMASVTKRPELVVGMHFFNPVPVMQLVEVIRGRQTADTTVELIRELACAIGKKPIVVEEFPGFVVNRLLVPMINEAIFMLEEGVASASDIDAAMVTGANHPIGPLALADLIGLDVCLAIMETLYQELGDDKYRPAPLLRKIVRAGDLGRKSGRGFYTYA